MVNLAPRITKSIDAALQLSKSYGVSGTDFGHVVILFVLIVITKLIDCVLEDCGISSGTTQEQESVYPTEGPQLMDLDVKGISAVKQNEHREQLRQKNTVMALEVLHIMASDRKIQAFLRLICLNMYVLNNLINMSTLLIFIPMGIQFCLQPIIIFWHLLPCWVTM